MPGSRTESQNSVKLSELRFPRPLAFWAGVAVCTIGVLLHLPMYLGARAVHYRMAGMQPDAPMVAGMVLIVVGLPLVAVGLVPERSSGVRETAARIRVAALDDVPLRPAHIALLAVMAVAVTIDVMKPITLAFVAPGMAAEYGLKTTAYSGHPSVALLPLFGIGGTVVGSVCWGWLGDRIGRRASILLAAIMFVTTSICGAMPGFTWNLLMCFVMGLGVGGLLPLAFVLMAETIPVRHRGWAMVLIGGDVAGAYIVTSWLAATLIPHYSWRIMWLLGIPTGLLLVMLNRWIPESPRYLLATGRPEAASEVMRRYGASFVADEHQVALPQRREGYGALFGSRHAATTVVIAVAGLGIGLITFGFQQWMPLNLRRMGFSDVTAAYILRDSSLIGFPLNFLVAGLYGFWSSKRTITLLSGLTCLALLGFTITGPSLAHHRALLSLLLAVPIWGISSLVAVVSAYSSEIYPTAIRAMGSGLCAAASKAGGVLILAVVAAAAVPSVAVTAIIGAIPLAAATALFAVVGRETRQRRLEEITPRASVARRC
jgi:MFS transporter, putative metabolite:H+ symporter